MCLCSFYHSIVLRGAFSLSTLRVRCFDYRYVPCKYNKSINQIVIYQFFNLSWDYTLWSNMFWRYQINIFSSTFPLNDYSSYKVHQWIDPFFSMFIEANIWIFSKWNWLIFKQTWPWRDKGIYSIHRNMLSITETFVVMHFDVSPFIIWKYCKWFNAALDIRALQVERSWIPKCNYHKRIIARML